MDANDKAVQRDSHRLAIWGAFLVALVSLVSNSLGFVAVPVALAIVAVVPWHRARRDDTRDRTTWYLLSLGTLLAALMSAAWGTTHSNPKASVMWAVAVVASSSSLIAFAWAGARIARPLLAARSVAIPALVSLAAFALIAIAWQWNVVTANRSDVRVLIPSLLVIGSAALLVSCALQHGHLTALKRRTERIILVAATVYGVGSSINAVAFPDATTAPSAVLLSNFAGCAIVAWASTTPGMALVGKPLSTFSDRPLSAVAPSAVVATLVADAALVLAISRWSPSLSVVVALVIIVVVQAALLGAAVAYGLSKSASGTAGRVLQRSRVSAAVAAGRIVAVYQPIVRSSDLQVVGFETLARWNHPVEGLIAANKFVGAADRAGLLASIDRTMIQTAAADHPALFKDRSVDERILTVNVHPRRLEEPGFALEVETELAKRGLDADGLTLEVTETAAIADWFHVNENVQLLQKMGVGIAVDDFGAGHANFDFLVRFEPDLVKVDRSLIEAAVSNARAQAMVRGCVDAARAAGAKVLAEGVHDLDWVPVLRDMGFDYFQGDAFGRGQRVEDTALD
jgi:EAL domain-containing protein (putative c-di-GMP-specific phosphodiesterase class I)